MPAFVWTAALLAGTPPLIVAAAVAPALLFAAAILFAQRGAGRPLRVLAASLLWGATAAAFLSTEGNELARRWIDAVAATDGRGVTAMLVAPVIEEAAKGLGLALIFLFARGRLRDARDGIVYGALIGVGFVFTENLLYLGLSMLQGGEAGLARAIWLRGAIGSATHLVFSASAGAGLAWAAANGNGARATFSGAVLGFAAALLQHLAWNSLAAPAIAKALCGAAADGTCVAVPGTAALFGEASAIALLFLAPGIVFLVMAAKAPRKLF